MAEQSEDGARASGGSPLASPKATNELEIIKRALRIGIGTHGEPCRARETCQAITDFREALAAVERLEAGVKHLESLVSELAFKRDSADYELDRQQARVAELEAAVLNSSGDNLCWLTEATGAGQVKIPPREEFLESCRRFHAQVSGEAGELSGCKTIAQLEAEIVRLEAERQSDTARLDWLEGEFRRDPDPLALAGPRRNYPITRAAIDAAMESTKGTSK